jgi:isocitrate dehydrogenase
MHSYDVAVGYKIITRPGVEQFMRFAFEYAKREGIKEITCGHKANIMKMTDGLFMNCFYDIAKEYPMIKANDLIVDDLAMKLVRIPDKFRLIVMTNLQGDILSDLCAGLVGGLGFAPSANIGDKISIFEAVHGTAPDIAGKGIANPSSLLMRGLMMLRHLGMISYADRIENAFLKTLEDGVHTGDFGDKSVPAVGTKEFAETIIANLDKIPTLGTAVATGTPDFSFNLHDTPDHLRMMYTKKHPTEKIEGVDIFIESTHQPEVLAEKIEKALPAEFKLQLISNRGTMVYPESSVFTDSVAHFCARIKHTTEEEINTEKIFSLCADLSRNSEFKIADVEILKSWDTLRGYSLAQGE